MTLIRDAHDAASQIRNATLDTVLKILRAASDLPDARRQINNLKLAMNDFDARAKDAPTDGT